MRNRLGVIVTSWGAAMILLCVCGNAEASPAEPMGVKGSVAFAIAAAEGITGGKVVSAMLRGDNCRVIVLTVDRSIETMQVNAQTGEITGRRPLVWDDEPMNEDSEDD